MIELRRHVDVEAAEASLRGEGFAFRGAPSRWRKDDADEAVYAQVLRTRDGTVAILSHRIPRMRAAD
jgi:hypothetical protein